MAEYTKNFNLKKPSQEDFYNVEDFNENFEKLDQNAVKKGEGIAELAGGILADRPEPGVVGRYFFAQDTGEIYLDTGTEWVLAAASRSELAAHLADDTRHVSQTEKNIWNSKAEGNHNHDGRYVQTRVYNGALQYYDGGWKNVAVSPIKSIQRGTHSGTTSDNDITITINTVNPAKCMVILNSSFISSYYYAIYAPILKNITSNSLVVSKSVYTSESGQAVPFSWQVIEYN